ncbi:hypothetical protein N7536_005048 [Penicillium majusculum]|nr:hypothetical protein N7536_005048 [Penicillium majusculum]
MTAFILHPTIPKALQSAMSTYCLFHIPTVNLSASTWCGVVWCGGAVKHDYQVSCENFPAVYKAANFITRCILQVKFENTHSHHKPRIHSLSKSLRFQRKKRTSYLGHDTFHIHDCTCRGYHLMT